MFTLSRSLFALGAALTLFAGITLEAGAHAALARSDPAAGAALVDAPSEVRLWFTEPLETRYTQARLLNSAGEEVPGVSSAIDLGDDHQLIATLPTDLPNGAYTVDWRTLSAADGHTLEGYFGFSIGSGAPVNAIAPEAVSPGNDTARALARGLALLGLAALLAIAPITLGVLDPAARTTPGLAETLQPRMRRYALMAAVLALLGSLAALATQTQTIAGDMALPTAMGETLTGTRYGQLWLTRLLGLLFVTIAVAIAFWGRPSWRRGALTAAILLAVAAPIPFSLLSHAAAQSEGRATAIAVDAFHLLAAAIWGGGLLILAAVLAPALRSFGAEVSRVAWREAIARFSVLGVAAWGVLLFSGLYSAWLQVGTIDALTATPYGQTLLLKGIFLVPVLALAAFHLILGWRGIPGLTTGRIARTIALEAFLVVAVLLVVGRLIGQEPAREALASGQPTQLQLPVELETDGGVRTGQLAITPGIVGVNTFTLDIAGSQLPQEAEGVLRFALPTQDIGQQELRLPQVAPNQFAADGPELAVAGDWQVSIIVRAIGSFSWETDATVAVSQTPPARPTINPAPLFGRAGIVGMIALAIGVAALAAAAVSRMAPPGRRVGVVVIGIAGLAAGILILSSARIPTGATMSPSRPSPVSTSPVSGSPPSAVEHDHAMASPESGTPQPLPGLGTPISENGLRVALDADVRQPGPTDITVSVSDEAGSPVSDARVVVFSEMDGMGKDSQGTAAIEVEPGRYRAEDLALSMSGPWQLSVRVSPRGQSTSLYRFEIDVP